MDEKVDCPYEQALLRARWKFVIYAVLAVSAPIVTAVLCYFFGKPIAWMPKAGAVMAAMAYLADSRVKDMGGALNPGGLVGATFIHTLNKYRFQVGLFQRFSIGIMLIGFFIGGFGELLLFSFN